MDAAVATGTDVAGAVGDGIGVSRGAKGDWRPLRAVQDTNGCAGVMVDGVPIASTSEVCNCLLAVEWTMGAVFETAGAGICFGNIVAVRCGVARVAEVTTDVLSDAAVQLVLSLWRWSRMALPECHWVSSAVPGRTGVTGAASIGAGAFRRGGVANGKGLHIDYCAEESLRVGNLAAQRQRYRAGHDFVFFCRQLRRRELRRDG